MRGGVRWLGRGKVRAAILNESMLFYGPDNHIVFTYLETVLLVDNSMNNEDEVTA